MVKLAHLFPLEWSIMSNQLSVSRDDVKRLSIYKQGLHQRPAKNSQGELKQIIERIGLLQLDSISVVARSHYLVMLARAGLYNRSELDDLLTDGFLVEQWAHAACQLPMAHYPYYYPVLQQKQLKESKHHIKSLGDATEEIVQRVLDAIRENGAMSSKDFDSARKSKGGWWNWKPAKIALEYLFDRGELMVSTRHKFQRYYDLPERVLNGREITLNKTLDDYQQWTTLCGLHHLGIGTIADIADYYRQPKRQTATIIQQFVDAGDVLPVEVIGWQQPAYIHHDDLPLLEEIQTGKHTPELTVFLSPFDNLIWNRDRTEALWDFFYRIEVYTPKDKRIYGYYVMPILHRGELIGRIDPKIDRKAKKLMIHTLHLEDGVEVSDEMSEGIIAALREFMAFHHCTTFELSTCKDKSLKKRIVKAMK